MCETSEWNVTSVDEGLKKARKKKNKKNLKRNLKNKKKKWNKWMNGKGSVTKST